MGDNPVCMIFFQFLPGSKPPQYSHSIHSSCLSSLHICPSVPHIDAFLRRHSKKSRHSQWAVWSRFSAHRIALPLNTVKIASAENPFHSLHCRLMRFIRADRQTDVPSLQRILSLYHPLIRNYTVQRILGKHLGISALPLVQMRQLIVLAVP